MRNDDFRNQTDPWDWLSRKGKSKKIGNRLARARLKRSDQKIYREASSQAKLQN